MNAGLLLSFYGDDFTGSTDAMEALAVAGLRTVLFLEAPEPALLAARFAGVRCIGVAGTSRTMSPDEMDAELLPVLRALWAAGAPLLHYKVCSTFDSSPSTGSIGHVAAFARRELNGGATVPVLAGAPPLRRYTVFGHHFAAAGPEVHRLDRHPTMARHPVTPMDEADLRLHLARQGAGSVALMSVTDLEGEEAAVDARFAQHMARNPELLLYDVLDSPRLRAAGRLIWQQAQSSRQFAVGSSGLGYALSAHWRATGVLPEQPAPLAVVTPVDRLLVMSGSASPMTARQIAWARAQGFEAIHASGEAFVLPERREAARARILARALSALQAGRSVLVYSAEGPGDPGVAATRALLERPAAAARVLGTAMGRMARELLVRSGVRRLVIAGGDTSSYAARELGILALETRAALTPGAPLCRVHADDPALDGLELALKGGQMGEEDYFGRAAGR